MGPDGTIINVTISGNTASNRGGGVAVDYGILTISSSTLANNTAPSGGGVGVINSPAIEVANTIIANSTGSDCNIGAATLTAQAMNLDSDGTCAASAGSNFITDDPMLGTLQNNGGLTDTHALLAGSSAIDAGDNFATSSGY